MFFGGIEDNVHARKLYPDIIVPKKETLRGAYIKKMKKADICIATTGLHHSIGWKMGEYVASGKAILSQPLYYDVPGNFEEGINYLKFSDAEQCLLQIDFLVSHPERIVSLQRSNLAYYANYGKPEKMIENTMVLLGREK